MPSRTLRKTLLFATLALTSSFGSAQERPAAIHNVILVHGAWADGSSWSKIIPLLEQRGLHVVAVQHPLSSLADDVAATKRMIDAQDGPVLLVGHSYGGAIITEVGDHPKVAGLVYVAAFAPDAGETLSGLASRFPKMPAFAEVRPIGDGFLVLTPKGVAEDFAQDLTTAEKHVLTVTQGATQGAILSTPITNAAWHNKPSWFVVAENDRTISPDQERSTAARMGATVLSVPTSHVAMLAAPKAVADFVISATGISSTPIAALDKRAERQQRRAQRVGEKPLD